MTADPILGRMGTFLPHDAGERLADADAAATMGQVRWSRAACLVTPAGHLLRVVDVGHAPSTDPRLKENPSGTRFCGVCGDRWPCASRLQEVYAEVAA